MVKKYIISGIIFISFGVVWAAQSLSKTPSFVKDTENSLWVSLGEEIVTEGIYPVYETSEGKMEKVILNGKTGWTIKPVIRKNGQKVGGYWYFDVLPWEKWIEWFKEGMKLELTFCYFDAGKRAGLSYDSIFGPWKIVPEVNNIITNSRKWKIKTVEIPDPYFKKRCNNHDFRFTFSPKESDFALAWIVLRRVPKKEEDIYEMPKKVSVSFSKLENLVSYNKGIRLPVDYYNQISENIVLEAEDATELSFQPSGGICFDKESSGNSYIERLNYGEWKFKIENPGKYQSWERAYFPWGGFWNHSESMDDGLHHTVIDNRNEVEKLKKWIWVKGPIYNLEKGYHIWKFHNYHGGAKLDQLLLTPNLEFIPQGKIVKLSQINGHQGKSISFFLPSHKNSIVRTNIYYFIFLFASQSEQFRYNISLYERKFFFFLSKGCQTS